MYHGSASTAVADIVSAARRWWWWYCNNSRSGIVAAEAARPWRYHDGDSDNSNDQRISRKEFESGLGFAADIVFKKSRRDSKRGSMGALTGTSDIDLEFELDDDDDDEDDDEMELESTVTGMVQIEMNNGKQ